MLFTSLPTRTENGWIGELGIKLAKGMLKDRFRGLTYSDKPILFTVV